MFCDAIAAVEFFGGAGIGEVAVWPIWAALVHPYPEPQVHQDDQQRRHERWVPQLRRAGSVCRSWMTYMGVTEQLVNALAVMKEGFQSVVWHELSNSPTDIDTDLHVIQHRPGSFGNRSVPRPVGLLDASLGVSREMMCKQRTCVKLVGMHNRQGAQHRAKQTEQLPFEVSPSNGL
jgi:hypothetical protein